MKRILVVCVGNVCRSPMAERLLAQRLPQGWEVTSAGATALVGSPMDADAAAELVARGGVPDGFAARQLTPSLVDAADVVLTATRDVRSRVLSEAPAAMRRTFTLLELAALVDEVPLDGSLTEVVRRAAQERSRAAHHELDVPDPYRRGEGAHREAADLVDAACRRLATALEGLD